LERRLAAILAADMVGYSRLMAADEAGTLARQNALRSELIDPKVAEYGGHLVKATGDGVLVEFPSVVDALRCAVTVQLAMADREAAGPEETRIAYRIGINLGDIIIEDDDIYGDGVNVAARLEALAEPGGICVSRTVVDHVKGKVASDFADQGEQEVKNIPEPIHVFRVVMQPEAAGESAVAIKPKGWWRSPLPAAVAVLAIVGLGIMVWQPWAPDVEPASLEGMAFPLPDKPSVAVLPFLNLSGDAAQDYFVDGVTEDVITELARFPEIFVIARTSSFTYKDKAVPVGQIAEELGVRYVVEGSVRRDDANLVITVQLIDATSGRHLWAERYQRPTSEFQALGNELVQAIVSTLAGRVEDARQRIASRKGTNSLSAYELTLQGFALLDDYSKASNLEARKRFEHALALDPQYVRAYQGYSQTHVLDYLFDWSDDSQLSLRLGREAAIKAVKLDNADYRSHFALGWVYLHEKRFEEALAEFEEGLSLNPSDARSLAEAGSALTFLGEMEKAVEQIQKAMRYDPFHPDWYFGFLGWAYYFLKDYDEALRITSRISSPTAGDHRLLAAIYARLGDLESAQAHAGKVLEAEPDFKVSIFADTMSFRDPAILQDYLEGLIEAGLPE
jgi:adenylate cyclase